ncbi:DEAD/DEAH box helicase [Kistimonas asteriae]|uniref:DEAD/DEAH box helicase n=1 Tax=Kistimonas asteriae TaxID=517724 RepID=UPI001BA97311|nr:DEAD/DEAH box helicase [Kistimonas asteriae]
MARCIPDKALNDSTEAVRLFNLLKRSLDDKYILRQRIPGEDWAPTFWIEHDSGRHLFLVVSPVKAGEITKLATSNTPDLFGSAKTTAPFGTGEQQHLESFYTRIQQDLTGSMPTGLIRTVAPVAVVFFNLRQADIKDLLDSPTALLKTTPATCGEQLKGEKGAVWIKRHLGLNAGKLLPESLRRTFSPETMVPTSITTRRIKRQDKRERQTGFFLDYQQEWASKIDLAPPEEHVQMSRDFSLRLLNGVAGGGKSLILLYRARLLRQLFPDSRILCLIHNRPVTREMERRYRILTNDDNGVLWLTFMAWCKQFYPQGKPLQPHIRHSLISGIHREFLSQSRLTASQLGDEFTFIKDRLIFSETDYLNADRTGRGFALRESERALVYRALEAYDRKVTAIPHRFDWADLPRIVWQQFQSGTVSVPQYEHVLIDEAQFFAPVWFELVKMITSKGTGQLFLAADPSQGFLKRRLSWVQAGLEVRGRTHRLDRSYRTTTGILQAATRFRKLRLSDDPEQYVEPAFTNMPVGDSPRLILTDSPNDEILRTAGEIKSLLNAGIPGRDILVVYADGIRQQPLTDVFEQALGKKCYWLMTSKAKDNEQAVRLCPLGAATGLESPIVFLLGLQGLLDKESALELTDDERAELVEENTRKIYMAMTRAGQKLAITWPNDEVPEVMVSALSSPSNENAVAV